MPQLREVPVAPASPERFRPVLGDGYVQVEEAIATASRILRGRVIWHVNSTARGGGVAEMLQSLLAYARGAGVDVRWLTVSGTPEFFRITKRLHNRLHGTPGDGGPLGDAERAIYEDTLREAAGELAAMIRPGDIVYLHDPQPAPLARLIDHADVAHVWRCHVGVDEPNDLAREAWRFLLPYIEDADACVFSRREFVWDGVRPEQVWIVAPSIDVFSPKNQELTDEAAHAILATIGLGANHGGPPLFQREDGSAARVNRVAELDQDAPIPLDAHVVAQISRWDRLKDPSGVLQCFADHCRDPAVHLVLAGPWVSGVADDPEGGGVLEAVRRQRLALAPELRARVHLACLPMEDVGENAAMVNAIQRRADVVLQKSLAEGFGLTVAEAMWKARPVVASRVGGIQDQVVDGESGILVDPADLVAVGSAIQGLLADPERAHRMGTAARERVRQEYLGTRHLVQYMQLIQKLLRTRQADG